MMLTLLLSLDAFNDLFCLYLSRCEFVLFSEWLFVVLDMIRLPVLFLMC